VAVVIEGAGQVGVIVLDAAAGAVQPEREAVTVKVQAVVVNGVPFAVAV
jgi:hypothetical protein